MPSRSRKRCVSPVAESCMGVGELTAQPLDPARSILLVLCEEYLGVAAGPERVRQPCAQLTVIQNLPVEDEVSMPASASHRLLRPGDIDDRQAGMSESDITLRPDSRVVWPAMKQPRGHIGQQFAAHRLAVEPADSGYSAHMTSASIVPAVTSQLKALVQPSSNADAPTLNDITRQDTPSLFLA